jgi:hypothetical protein
MSDRGFRVILIKPSHYDDDGYVIQWRRSPIPSNSLASGTLQPQRRAPPAALSVRMGRGEANEAGVEYFP